MLLRDAITVAVSRLNAVRAGAGTIAVVHDEPSKPAMKVLIVDDSPEVQVSLRRLLGTVAGLRIVGCAEGTAHATELIDAEQPDVVVLDVDLRNGDRGYDVLRYAAREHPQVQVLMLSNFTWRAMRDGFLEAGARAYFDKAYEVGKLRDWLIERVRERAATLH